MFQQATPIVLAVTFSIVSTIDALGNEFETTWIPPALREPHEIDDGFDDDERRLLKNAVDLVYRRFMSSRVERNFEHETQQTGHPEKTKAGVFVNDRAADRHGWKIDPKSESNHLYFMAQRFRFWVHVFEQGDCKFPKLVIKSAYADPEGDTEFDRKWGNAHAWASVGTVVVHPSSVRREDAIEGHFELTINRYFLNSLRAREYRDPNYWAGTITHEMLHNLGHLHPDVSDPSYRLYEINIFARSVTCNGTYRWGQSYFPVQCGCKDR